MALPATTPSFSPSSSLRNYHSNLKFSGRRLRVMAYDDSPSEESATGKKRKHVDTRIHWSNQEDGWIGTKKSTSQTDKAEKKAPFGGRFADLIDQATTSHYQLSVPLYFYLSFRGLLGVTSSQFQYNIREIMHFPYCFQQRSS